MVKTLAEALYPNPKLQISKAHFKAKCRAPAHPPKLSEGRGKEVKVPLPGCPERGGRGTAKADVA